MSRVTAVSYHLTTERMTTMKTTDMVPRTVPIIGPPAQVRRAIDTQYRAGRLLTHPQDIRFRRLADGRVATDITVMTPPAPAPRPVRRDDTFRQIMFALIWVGGLFVGGALLIALAGWLLFASLGPMVVLGALGLGALVIAFAVNRQGHSGACPGIVVHCAGCRH